MPAAAQKPLTCAIACVDAGSGRRSWLAQLGAGTGRNKKCFKVYGLCLWFLWFLESKSTAVQAGRNKNGGHIVA
jgi:hypothetical protein